MNGRRPQACNACRLRKVKCDRAQPCSQCVNVRLQCVHSAAPSKRNAPVRGRLISQAREEHPEQEAQVVSGSLPLSPPAPMSPVGGGPPESSSRVAEGAGAYTNDFFLALLPSFEELVYPVNPVLSPDDIRESIWKMGTTSEDAALVYAFAAITMYLTWSPAALDATASGQMDDLIRRSLHAYRQADVNETGCSTLAELHVTVKRVMACIFLEVSMMAFKRFDRSFAMLREAIALLEVRRLQPVGPGDALTESFGAARFQRLYWEAFIHERFLTITAGYPSILPPLKTGLPTSDPSLPPHIELGFNRIIELFLILDTPFLDHWQAQQGLVATAPWVTAQWIESKQTQLDQDELTAAEAETKLVASGSNGFTDLQRVDLFVTRLWLRTIVWQLALSHGVLQSQPPENAHEGLSIHFPTQRLSMQLRRLVARLDSVASIARQGTGILQKLFEITSTIADVMVLPQAQSQFHDDAGARLHDLSYVVQCLLTFQWARAEQRDYLRDKLAMLNRNYGYTSAETGLGNDG